MYICVKNGEESKALLKFLLKNNIPVNVSDHDILSWYDIDLIKGGFSALILVYAKCLRIISKSDTRAFELSFEALDCVYGL